MGVNGSRGRAKVMRQIMKRRLAEAVENGIDPNDRKAVDAFHLEKLRGIVDRARAYACANAMNKE